MFDVFFNDFFSTIYENEKLSIHEENCSHKYNAFESNARDDGKNSIQDINMRRDVFVCMSEHILRVQYGYDTPKMRAY